MSKQSDAYQQEQLKSLVQRAIEQGKANYDRLLKERADDPAWQHLYADPEYQRLKAISEAADSETQGVETQALRAKRLKAQDAELAIAKMKRQYGVDENPKWVRADTPERFIEWIENHAKVVWRACDDHKLDDWRSNLVAARSKAGKLVADRTVLPAVPESRPDRDSGEDYLDSLIRAVKPPVEPYSHNEEFTSVFWTDEAGDRKAFQFKGDAAEAVKVLWQAGLSGHSLRDREIGNRIGSSSVSFRLEGVFRRGTEHHAAWMTMIKRPAAATYQIFFPFKK